VGIDKPNRREVNEAAAYVVKRHGVHEGGRQGAGQGLADATAQLSLARHSAGPF
jgi:putative DNA primase/helicase